MPCINIRSTKELSRAMEGGKGQVIVVEFCAAWCGLCTQMRPVVDRMCAEYRGSAVFLRVDVDLSAELCKEYAVTEMPTYLVYGRGGALRRKVIGADVPRLGQTVDDAIAEDREQKIAESPPALAAGV